MGSGDANAYAAYYTDENRLLAWLKAEGRQGEADAISETTDRAARAGLFRTIQGDLPDFLFERLPGAVVASAPTVRRLRHAISGSSRVLNGYKIAVEAGRSGARPDLGSLDMVFYGVPNSDPPPQPSVAAKLVEPQGGEPSLVVEVTISVEAGVTSGVTARLFRTRGEQADPLHAPVVVDLPLSAPDPVTGRQQAVARDIGEAQIALGARLRAFSRYQWLAQVQGAPEFGSAVPGMWSRASDPVGVATVPLTNPAAPSFDGFGGTPVTGGTENITLEISHALSLAPTPLGNWRYEVLRALPGEEWSLWKEGDIPATPLFVSDPAPGSITPAATSFGLRLYDPSGRPTPAIVVVPS